MINCNIGALARFGSGLFRWFNHRKDNGYVIAQALKTKKGQASLSEALLEALKKVQIDQIND